jgi:hypothetical protein
MNKEDLEKANTIKKRIDILTENIKRSEYMLSKNVVERESYITFNGNDGLEVRKTLFKKLALIVQKEDKKELIELTKQFELL